MYRLVGNLAFENVFTLKWPFALRCFGCCIFFYFYVCVCIYMVAICIVERSLLNKSFCDLFCVALIWNIYSKTRPCAVLLFCFWQKVKNRKRKCSARKEKRKGIKYIILICQYRYCMCCVDICQMLLKKKNHDRLNNEKCKYFTLTKIKYLWWRWLASRPPVRASFLWGNPVSGSSNRLARMGWPPIPRKTNTRGSCCSVQMRLIINLFLTFFQK